MSLLSHTRLMKHLSSFGCMLFFTAGLAHAQSAPANSSTDALGWSSSQAGDQQLAEAAVPSAMPSAPGAAMSGAAQNDSNTNYSGWKGHDIANRLTFEAGGGFNAPAGDKAYVTWGGQFTLGAGVNFNRRLAMMMEYQFLDSKLPGAIISEAGATGGYDHIWSLTLDPVFDLFPKSSNDLYITGGGGFYRKVTSFTDPQEAEYCDYYYGICGTTVENAVVGHFSSNQGGFNIGGGYQHRFGGMYGEGHTRFFAEARYLDVLSPAVTGITPSGLGITTVGADTKLLPVTVGIRW